MIDQPTPDNIWKMLPISSAQKENLFIAKIILSMDGKSK